ncbi:MAG TPA: hypothetical protein VGE32_02005 [Cellvibrio sp.]
MIYLSRTYHFVSMLIILLGSMTQQVVHASNFSSNASAFGETLFAMPTIWAQLQFPYNLNTDYVTTTTTGTGASVTQATNLASLTTGNVLASSATMTSNKRLHYHPGQGAVCMFDAVFTTGTANTSQIIGMGNTQDGFFFGYSGATFGIIQRVNSVDTLIPQTAWNGDKMDGTGKSGVTLVKTNGNLYKIQMQWLGFGAIKFYIVNPDDGTFILVHTIKYANANTTASLLNPSLQLYAFVSCTALFTAAVTLKTSSMVGMVEGNINTGLDTRNAVTSFNPFPGTLPKNLTTTFANVLGIRNNPTFQGKTNQVMIYPDQITFMNTIAAAASSMIYTLILNPTTVTGQTYTQINANTSVVSYDVAGTTVTGGKILMTFYVNGSSSMVLDLTDYQLQLSPGDQLIIAGRTVAGTGNAFVGISWKERF